ncbi:MAG: VanZ family protein [Oscillospiraceae bacterium]|nr:VanZ family protein [Oscillospiraceae bacterium]
MKRKMIGQWLCAALLILTLIFIWGNSVQSGPRSAALSEFVKRILEEILGLESGGSEIGQHGLRKFAHFAEFACLGILLTWLVSMSGRMGARLVCPVLLGGLLTACVDEAIQMLAPERGPSLVDVGIDACGVAVGMTLFLLGRYLLTKRTKT